MSPQDEVMARAEALNRDMRAMSDLLTGAVHTLVGEGWTEEQARTIVVSTFANAARGGK